MGKVTGFMESTVTTGLRAGRRPHHHFDEFVVPLPSEKEVKTQARAAWIAAFPSVTRAVR
jgi:hypothetical protein